MKLKLTRTLKTSSFTEGKLYINDVYFCDTIEDCDRNLSDDMFSDEVKIKKIYGKTAIPKGIYNINMNIISPKFADKTWAHFCNGKLPRLIDVKGFEGILIHVLNTAEESLGCIGVGKKTKDGFISNSTETFKKLYEILEPNKEQLTITIL